MLLNAKSEKRIIVTACLIVTMLSADAQKKFSVKLYQNTDFYEKEYYDSRTDERAVVRNTNFHRLTLAFDIETEKRITHEIELMIPEISKPLKDILYPLAYSFRKNAAFDGHASTYSLRYELSKTLTREPHPFAFNLGLGVNPYYIFVEYIPTNETVYYGSAKLYGLALNVIPRMEYKISKRFCIDLNVPLRCYDLRRERHHIKNPAIPIRHQTAEETNHYFFVNAYTIRLGVRYALSEE